MSEQLALSFERAAVVPAEVNDLETYLRGKGWVPIQAIEKDTGWNDRKIRAVASDSDLIISRPGRPGYCHADDITLADYEQARRAMLSQPRKMIGRVVRWDRRVYRRLRPQAR